MRLNPSSTIPSTTWSPPHERPGAGGSRGGAGGRFFCRMETISQPTHLCWTVCSISFSTSGESPYTSAVEEVATDTHYWGAQHYVGCWGLQ